MTAMVRRAKFGDEEGIHVAHMRSIRELCAKDYRQEQIIAWGGREFDLEAKQNLIKNQYMWVVQKSAIIEGYGLLIINDEKKVASIGGLYFTPAVVGLGFGKQIISEMKTIAKSKGFSFLILESTITSKAFYKKQGAVQYKADIALAIGGIPIECHPMRIDL